jgi:NADH dehydrogenase
MVFMSFLRARPNCGSAYHESKWAAEEMIRSSALDYTIVKAGMTYGTGDHMLDHLSHSLYTLPLFATVGIVEKPIRPLAIEDLLAVLRASAVEGRLSRKRWRSSVPRNCVLAKPCAEWPPCLESECSSSHVRLLVNACWR